MQKVITTQYLSDDGTPLCTLDAGGNLQVQMRKTSAAIALQLSEALLDAAKEQNKIEKAAEKKLAASHG